MNAPKIFLSHASEDKERFVIRFATALRQRGIDIRLDKWEIVPGDIDRVEARRILRRRAPRW